MLVYFKLTHYNSLAYKLLYFKLTHYNSLAYKLLYFKLIHYKTNVLLIKCSGHPVRLKADAGYKINQIIIKIKK